MSQGELEPAEPSHEPPRRWGVIYASVIGVELLVLLALAAFSRHFS